MAGDFAFSIWKMAVFNSGSEVVWINFSFSSLVIFGLTGAKSFSCFSKLVCVFVYKVKFLQCCNISKSLVIVRVSLFFCFCDFLMVFCFCFCFPGQRKIYLVFLVLVLVFLYYVLLNLLFYNFLYPVSVGVLYLFCFDLDFVWFIHCL